MGLQYTPTRNTQQMIKEPRELSDSDFLIVSV